MNSDRPRVSIVIPVCNVAPYLRECLDSVVGQTLKDIEILCADDASTDGSLQILEEYAQKDPRIRLIRYATNRSASQGRKDGALSAKGEYILFLDGDDYLELNACEELVGLIQKQDVDILHFGTRVENADHAAERRIEAVQQFTRPYPGRLEGREVFEGCFRHAKYRYTLWNKLFSAVLCRKAFPHIQDGVFPKAQDLYAFFILAYFARSYQGVEDAPYHHYRFGSGITGRSRMTIGHFSTFCSQVKVSKAIRQFLEEQRALADYESEYDTLHDGLLSDCTWNWKMCLSPSEQAAGFDILSENWGAVDVLSSLAKQQWHKRAEIARAVQGARTLESQTAPIRTIGTYYHWICNGGVQRVLSSLIPLWLGMGYRVVLFTDTPPCEDDYPLPEGVRRVVLPSWQETNAENFGVRARQWEATLAENNVDAMIYHAWASRTLFWDLLVVKSQGIPFVVNTHSVFSALLTTANPYFAEMPALYALCDAVVSLSSVDQRFWGHFAKRAFYLPNPMTFDLAGTHCSAMDNQDVLWVGRFSPEKNPIDALRIMAQVVQSVPGARLLMLGKGTDEKFCAKIEGEIDALGIRNQVVMCGYHKDVERFYQAASVYLSTSSFEGFPLGLAESKSHGLPCVMYDLPFLELCRGYEGILAVGQGNIAEAAERIIALLQDGVYRKQMGAAARRSLESFATFDLAAGWKEVLDAIGSGRSTPVGSASVDETTQIMLQTLLCHYQTGTRRLSPTAQKELEKTRNTLADIQRSWSYRIGSAIMLVPNKIYSWILRPRP